MTSPTRMIAMAVGGVLAVWIGWSVIDSGWLTPRAGMLADIDELESSLVQRREALNRAPRIRRDLVLAANRTLAGEVQAVDHRFRTRLNRITEQVGLASPSVGTGGTSVRQSPARRLFSRRGAQRAFHEEIDFVELEGWVNGRGTLAEVLELIDRIEAEPWIKRIESVGLTPRDNGGRFDVAVRLRTLFMPNRGPDETPTEAYDGQRLARLASLIGRNPFRLAPDPPPPPAKPAEPEQTEPAPPPPEFPYGEWMLTGVAQGPDGAEIWLNSRKNQENRRLAVGDRIGDATLIAANGEFATFTIEESHFRIRVGGTLNDRQPVDV